jgi:nucleoid-associated protein YgaU
VTVNGFARSVRLVVGLGMIAAGSSLAAPACLQVTAWWQAADAPARDAAGWQAGSPPVAEVPPAPWAAAGPAATSAAGSAAGPVAGSAALPTPVWPADPGPASAALRGDYLPPPPPERLPAVAAGFSAPRPDLAPLYRTTLAVPPPPLLDGQRPPPLAVGWASRAAQQQAAVRQSPVVPPPGRYRVRDGDDLTSIATRFYGTPAVAREIWEANRDLLPDPGLLPIGLELRLPAPGTLVHGAPADRQRLIDPQAGQSVRPEPTVTAAPGGWLQAGDGRQP